MSTDDGNGGGQLNETTEPTVGYDHGTRDSQGPIDIRLRHIVDQYDDDEILQREAIHQIADAITDRESFIHPPADTQGWQETLYRYDRDRGIYRSNGERYCRELCERLLGDFLTNSRLSELVSKIKRMSGVRKDELGVEPYRLVVENGIVDLRTGELDGHTPDEYHQTRVPVAYEPSADCPRIDEFFHEIVDDSDVRTLYQLVAHCLYREYAAEKATMLIGDGQNGKSVYLDLIEQFLGEENVSHRSLQDLSEKDFATSDLHGKMANFLPDMSGEDVNDLATFKALTGRDTQLGDVKYEQPVKFENYATMIFGVNQMPALKEDTRGLWRRWICIDFPNTFEPGDPDYIPKHKLMEELTAEEELQGLLAKCVEEISDWWQNGRRWFTEANDPEQVRDRMMRAGNPVYAFTQDCLQVDAGESIPKTEVRQCYNRYAKDEGLPRVGAAKFGERLLNIDDYPVEGGRVRIKGKRTSVYKNVAWTDQARYLLEKDGSAFIEGVDESDDAAGDPFAEDDDDDDGVEEELI